MNNDNIGTERGYAQVTVRRSRSGQISVRYEDFATQATETNFEATAEGAARAEKLATEYLTDVVDVDVKAG